ncbi:YheC/D like ATP-grasp [Paenibacillaceae bacterium GAS479]|nr:YheC/D like ATP-grasp [Paenibacillaceae bacterium GAS479]
MSNDDDSSRAKLTVSSKMNKTDILLRSQKLKKHIPATRWLSLSKLTSMLDQYRMVYVKPDKGSKGIGVIRVEKTKYGFQYQRDTRVYRFETLASLHRSLQKLTDEKMYLVQRGIHLLKHEGRVYDFRIMVQRNPSGEWECTGTVARVAHPKKIVSNGSQGGTIYAPMDLLRPVCGKVRAVQLLKQMDGLALLTAKKLSEDYPRLNELGLDIAIDQKLKPWILEVNTLPDPCPFTKLDDKEIIDRIVEYAKGYGRRYKLNCMKAKKAP